MRIEQQTIRGQSPDIIFEVQVDLRHGKPAKLQRRFIKAGFVSPWYWNKWACVRAAQAYQARKLRQGQ